jgi:quercetin dioxygenase-like cupin family protein
MSYVINKDLPYRETANRFERYLYGGANVLFFLSETPPGKRSNLHTYPYDEGFVAQEREVTFTVGDATFEAKSGQILVLPAGVPTSS